jgi:hypothetical protein
MCYETRWFRSRAAKKAQSQERSAPVVERVHSPEPQVHTAQERRDVQPKEKERQLEEIV